MQKNNIQKIRTIKKKKINYNSYIGKTYKGKNSNLLIKIIGIRENLRGGEHYLILQDVAKGKTYDVQPTHFKHLLFKKV